MKNLENYRKRKEKATPKKPRSVFLELKHLKFLDAENLNLSKLVRELIDRLMKETDTDDL